VVDQEAPPVLTTRTVEICADGLLLYVAEASYETGTSPLSSWIPIAKYQEDRISEGTVDSSMSTDGPLDVFRRLVEKRIARKSENQHGSSSVSTTPSLQMDVET